MNPLIVHELARIKLADELDHAERSRHRITRRRRLPAGLSIPAWLVAPGRAGLRPAAAGSSASVA